jgi:thiol-disulfide isomerase/thioredoxin
MTAPMHRRDRSRAWRVSRLPAAALTLAALAVGGCGENGSPTGPPPPDSLADLFGATLYRADGSTVGIEQLEGTAVIGVYFGSGSCPACAEFTPRLVDVYQQIVAGGRSFEVVYVSFDGSASAMFEYMVDAGMPWLAVEYAGQHAVGLVERYDVQVIPTLVILDSEGRTVTLAGRDDVARQGAAAYDAWAAAGS